MIRFLDREEENSKSQCAAQRIWNPLSFGSGHAFTKGTHEDKGNRSKDTRGNSSGHFSKEQGDGGEGPDWRMVSKDESKEIMIVLASFWATMRLS